MLRNKFRVFLAKEGFTKIDIVENNQNFIYYGAELDGDWGTVKIDKNTGRAQWAPHYLVSWEFIGEVEL